MIKKILLLLCISMLCMISHAQKEKLRVAVLDPTTSGIAMDGGTKLAVQELISSAFVSTGKFIIIERSMIDKIIKEQAFQNSDMADNSQATEIGKLAGANKVVLSAVSLVGGRNMLSIKIIDVMTASIDQQKTKIVGTNDLLDVVEPLTMELLGEEANYVKQNTILAQTSGTEEKVPTKNVSAKNTSTVAAPKSTIDYNKATKDLLKQITAGIETAKSATNPKLAQLITAGKIQTSITLSGGLTAEINDAGVLQISGNGEMLPTDQKLIAIYRPHTTAIIVNEGVTKIQGFASFSKVQYVLLPNSLQCIEANCFKSSKMQAVNIPSAISKIGNNAFKGCANISSVFLPNKIDYIGSDVFAGCSNLVLINIPDNFTTIPEGLFNNCSSLSEIIIPNTITHIGKNAFRGCKSIQKLFIPDNVVSISEFTFQGMKGLQEIRLSENLAVIPTQAFDGCTSLFKVTCPASVKTVGEKAFCDCDNLVQIIFCAEDMTKIGKECFKDCKHLGTIVLYSLRPPICDWELFGKKDEDRFEEVTLAVPADCMQMYKKACGWKEFKAIVRVQQ